MVLGLISSIGIFKLSRQWILYPCLVIPFSLGLIMADQLFWGEAMKRSLPFSPESLLPFSLIFVFPHIMGSMLVAANREVLWPLKKVVFGTIFSVFLVFLVLFFLFGDEGIWVFYGITTIYHVVTQQGVFRNLREAQAHPVCLGLSLFLNLCWPPGRTKTL